MRFFISTTLLFICIIKIPLTQCDGKKYKLKESNDKDIRVSQTKYLKKDNSHHDEKLKIKYINDEHEGNQKRTTFSKNNLQPKQDDESSTIKKGRIVKIIQMRSKTNEVSEQSAYAEKNKNRNNNNEEPRKSTVIKIKKVSQKQEIVDDIDSDETEEDSISATCTKSKMNAGKRCVSKDDSEEESDEDDDDSSEENNNTDEADYDDDEGKTASKKKRVIYVKKFAHEKKGKELDHDFGNVIKLHKRGVPRKSGMNGNAWKINRLEDDTDDDSSEENVHPKRFQMKAEDDE